MHSRSSKCGESRQRKMQQIRTQESEEKKKDESESEPGPGKAWQTGVVGGVRVGGKPVPGIEKCEGCAKFDGTSHPLSHIFDYRKSEGEK